MSTNTKTPSSGAPGQTTADRPIAPLLVTPEPVDAGSAETLELAERIRPLLGCLERFCGETLEQLAELDAHFESESRPRLRRRLDTARQILHWTDGVLNDVHAELGRAAAGLRRTSCRRLLEDLLQAFADRRPSVTCRWGAVDDGVLWARQEELQELLRLGLDLTAQRIGAEGTLTIEICSSDGFVHVRFLGVGEVRPVSAPAQVSRLRELVRGSGGAVLPDVLGGGGSGMTLRLPAVAVPDVTGSR